MRKNSKRKNLGRPRSELAKKNILNATYNLLKDKGFRAIGYHEIAKAAGVSSATLYRWWDCKEEILFDACFYNYRPFVPVSESGSALESFHQYILRVAEFLVSENGIVISRLICGINDNKKLHEIYLKRYIIPRRKIQVGLIKEAIASGELKRDTDPELLIDAVTGPLYFRWLQRHAPLDRKFAEKIFNKFIPVFKNNTARGPRTQRSIVRKTKG